MLCKSIFLCATLLYPSDSFPEVFLSSCAVAYAAAQPLFIRAVIKAFQYACLKASVLSPKPLYPYNSAVFATALFANSLVIAAFTGLVAINIFSDIKVIYEKIKIGEHINNKVEKIRFKIINNSKSSEKKNKELVQHINSIMDLIKNDVKDFHATYELIKKYILKKNYDYVYTNVIFTKKQFKNNIEKQLKKVLLLDLAQFSKTNFRNESEIINIKKKYITSFFLQLDVANLMRQNHLENELRVIVDDGYFNEILTLKNKQILKKDFYDFKIYIQYFQNTKSIIKLTKFF